MILLIRRRVLLILIFATVGFALAMSVLAYVAVHAAGELGAPERKALAERVLFVGIVGSLVLVAGLAVAAYQTISLNRLLRRLSDTHRMSGDQLHLALRRFGSVGGQLGNLYRNINALSDLKSRRIAAMNSLLATILTRSQSKMVVVNAAGQVYQATSAALEYLDLSSSDVTEEPIDSIIEGESFSETAATLARSAGTYAIEGHDETVTVIRVLGDQGIAAYYIYLLGNDAADELNRDRPARPSAKEDAGTGAKGESSERGGERRNAIRSFLNFVSRKRS